MSRCCLEFIYLLPSGCSGVLFRSVCWRSPPRGKSRARMFRAALRSRHMTRPQPPRLRQAPPLRNRPDSRVPQHRGHHPQLVRRNPQLAPQPPFQRTPRRHQQPNPNPPQNRPRLHKPPKLRRPRTPPNMNPTTNQPDHNPTNSRRANIIIVPAVALGILHGALRRVGTVGNPPFSGTCGPRCRGMRLPHGPRRGCSR